MSQRDSLGKFNCLLFILLVVIICNLPSAIQLTEAQKQKFLSAAQMFDSVKTSLTHANRQALIAGSFSDIAQHSLDFHLRQIDALKIKLDDAVDKLKLLT